MKRRTALGITILLLLIPLLLAPSQLAADEIQDKQRELEQLNQAKQQQEQQLQASREKRESLTDGLLRIDRSLYAALERQRAAEVQLEQVTVEIYDTSRRIETIERSLARHQEDLERRLVAIYKEGSVSTLEVLLNAHDFSDLLSKAGGLEALASRDQELVERVQQDQKALAAEKEQLAQRETRSKDLKAEIEAEKGEVEVQLAAQTQLLDTTKASERQATVELTDMDRQSDALTETIRQLEEEKAARELAEKIARERAAREQAERERLAREAAERASQQASGAQPAPVRALDTRVSNSGFMWPESGIITTHYGGQTPYQSFHTGLDIATGGTGVPIVAALDGVVIKRGYSVPGNRRASYGMMVVISHGGGLTTLYAHMDDQSSPPPVSEGDVVRQGQVIGYVGMTGYTTGPHLHFEVRQDGVTQNPEAYLP